MKNKIYQIDTFTNKVFSGNPAAVCPLESWLSDEMMQNIAMENNLAETAFYVKNGNKFEIRWFTPTVEVDLCGHATLAAAFVLFNFESNQIQNNKIESNNDIIEFYSPRSGILSVKRNNEYLTLNFPKDLYTNIEITKEIKDCFSIEPNSAFKGKTDYMLIFESETEIASIIPNLENISKLNARGVIITAKGDNVDFVSRFFAPQSGINEDPVTGSSHTTLTPYWANILGKSELTAIQLSDRKGYLDCKMIKDRIEISGLCKLYLIGDIYL